jgi:hypothetical protein
VADLEAKLVAAQEERNKLEGKIKLFYMIINLLKYDILFTKTEIKIETERRANEAKGVQDKIFEGFNFYNYF